MFMLFRVNRADEVLKEFEYQFCNTKDRYQKLHVKKGE
jgi:hypothetical protein